MSLLVNQENACIVVSKRAAANAGCFINDTQGCSCGRKNFLNQSRL